MVVAIEILWVDAECVEVKRWAPRGCVWEYQACMGVWPCTCTSQTIDRAEVLGQIRELFLGLQCGVCVVCVGGRGTTTTTLASVSVHHTVVSNRWENESCSSRARFVFDSKQASCRCRLCRRTLSQLSSISAFRRPQISRARERESERSRDQEIKRPRDQERDQEREIKRSRDQERRTKETPAHVAAVRSPGH